MTVRRMTGLALVACAVPLVTSCGSDGGDSQAPSSPAGVTVHAGSSTSVHVMWNEATDNVAVTGYAVYRGGTRVKDVPDRQNMVDVTGLKPSASYTFAVRARDAAGNVSPRSKEVPVTMPSAAVDDRRPPTAPANARGRADGARAATLAWGRSKDNHGVASYDIYQGGSKIHSVGGNETTALVTGLRPGTGYTFTVKARDAADNVSPASRAVRVTTTSASGGGTGTAPTGLRARTHADGGARYLDLTWTPPKTGGAVTEYQIYLDGKFASTLVYGDEAAAPEDRAEYSLQVDKAPGTAYTVKIRAKLPDGNWGAFSAQETVTAR